MILVVSEATLVVLVWRLAAVGPLTSHHTRGLGSPGRAAHGEARHSTLITSFREAAAGRRPAPPRPGLRRLVWSESDVAGVAWRGMAWHGDPVG